MFSEEHKKVAVNFETDLKSTIKFIRKFHTIIISPDSLLLDRDIVPTALDDYIAKGGHVIPFEYLIERASLVEIEEQVDRVMKEKYHFQASRSLE